MTGNYVPFSQRVGLTPVPPQLQLGEVSAELRRLLEYALSLEIDRATGAGYGSTYFRDSWRQVSRELHVRYFQRSIRNYDADPRATVHALQRVITSGNIGALFDLVEFLFHQPGCSEQFKEEMSGAFVRARAAYRAIDNCIVAVGTEEQADSFQMAIANAEENNALSARRHLISAGSELRAGNWPGSVRESINAVEAVSRLVAPGTDAVSHALSVVEQNGHLHGALKKAFLALYGYASDQEGVRHALVFEDEANVDEADALFMLGACASFVSYLLARVPQQPDQHGQDGT
jgi:hypothetical protein